MRQAGRYLPEYRETRRRAGDFMTLCTTPELACEVTLQPLARFPLDAAILFSDILTVPHAMGLGLSVSEGTGPRFEQPIRSAADIRALRVPDPEDKLDYVLDTIRLIRQELDGRVPLIGFAGSPWTLATYMVEGGTSRDFHQVKGLMYEQPLLMHELLQTLANAVTQYLNLQQIIQGLTKVHEGRRVPVILFTKGGGQWLEMIAETGCEAVGLDWTQDIGQARHRVGHRLALQGNMDPAVLLASPRRIREEVGAILADFGPGTGHVFNLGHGITPEVKPEHVSVLAEAVHEMSLPYHAA
jgi:uroporphyrinogen decarboxylase